MNPARLYVKKGNRRADYMMVFRRPRQQFGQISSVCGDEHGQIHVIEAARFNLKRPVFPQHP
jgi:hypothetical protein